MYANLFTNKMSIVLDHNSRRKKQISFEDVFEIMVGNILGHISNSHVEFKTMRDEFLNMKNVIIKRLKGYCSIC